MQVVLDDYTQGAVLATELANTSPTVWVVAGDRLTDIEAVQSLLDDNDVRSTAPTGTHDLEQVRALRDRLRDILDAPAPAELITLTHDALSVVPHRIELTEIDGEWRWQAATEKDCSLADELTMLTGYALLGTVRALGIERFRACASPTCNGVFVDVSRGGRRRYCMPGLCGNRINVANHRQRRRSPGEA